MSNIILYQPLALARGFQGFPGVSKGLIAITKKRNDEILIENENLIAAQREEFKSMRIPR